MNDHDNTITGYRELTATEIHTINEINRVAKSCNTLILHLQQTNPNIDTRWVAIGKTNLQTGFMALTRAIAQPESF